MVEYKSKCNFTRETISFLNSLDVQIMEKLKEIKRMGNYMNFDVKYGSSIIDDNKSDSAYIIKSNSSLSLQGSNKFLGEISTYLKRREKELNSFLEQGTIFFVEILFEEKKINENDNPNLIFFHPINPRYSFEQVILSEDVKKDIKEAINIVKYQHLIYTCWGFEEIDPIPKSVINFYGPPGTGKTMTAHAVAKELNKQLLALNYAEIESKYVGDAAKNLTNAFKTAKESDCVLFFDEADSFLGKRIQNVTQGAEQALNSLRSQMLILLEEFSGVVIFATNLVSNFDQAFESRILKHIHFPLPNEDARIAIIKKTIPRRLPLEGSLTEQHLREISSLCEGFSGREIKGAIQECLLSKASEEGQNAVFCFEDFKNAFINKADSLKRLEEEKQKDKKAKILKALTNSKSLNTDTKDDKNDGEKSRTD